MRVAGCARGLRERGPGRRREGWARRLLEGVGVGGVVRHERLAVQGRAAELGQEAQLRVVLAVSGHEHGRQNWGEEGTSTLEPRLTRPKESGGGLLFVYPFLGDKLLFSLWEPPVHHSVCSS